jgi:hypothetical protein
MSGKKLQRAGKKRAGITGKNKAGKRVGTKDRKMSRNMGNNSDRKTGRNSGRNLGRRKRARIRAGAWAGIRAGTRAGYLKKVPASIQLLKVCFNFFSIFISKFSPKIQNSR